MFGKTRLSFVVVGPILGPQCLYCLLSLLRLIFKAYKDLTPFICTCCMSRRRTYSMRVVQDIIGESFED